MIAPLPKTMARAMPSPRAEPGRVPLRELSPETYDELRALAEHLLRRRRGPDALRTTSLVHEAYLRLAVSEEAGGRTPGHLLACAAHAMRSILVDRARRRKAAKRGGGAHAIPLDELAIASPALDDDCLALDEALTQLAAVDERKARIVELRFFGGLLVEEIAEVLGVSCSTVKRDWPLAKAWLHRELYGRSQPREEST